MTRLGRKPQGAELVDALAGSEHAKARLKLFLQTMADELSIGAACQQLGICASRFYEQRTAWLHDSIAFLEPRAAGRPRKDEAVITPAELQAELVRTLPQVVARAAAPKKTPSLRRTPRRQKSRSCP